MSHSPPLSIGELRLGWLPSNARVAVVAVVVETAHPAPLEGAHVTRDVVAARILVHLEFAHGAEHYALTLFLLSKPVNEGFLAVSEVGVPRLPTLEAHLSPAVSTNQHSVVNGFRVDFAVAFRVGAEPKQGIVQVVFASLKTLNFLQHIGLILE